MTDEPSRSRSQIESDELEAEGSDAESWLRKAARVPDSDARIPLPQPGQVIADKYRIEELLGKGGMGAVYRATHVVSDKQVALKWMLRPASDERALQRFTREARAAGRIDHPNVVDVYDIGQDGDASYLVMELLHGESLRQRLTKGPPAVGAAMDLLLPAMRGVAAAHRDGVIHRDLKPDNIFLCRAPNGEAREAKVLDFGISTISRSDAEHGTTLTKEGTVLGTPAYMSPEQLESVRDADARTDVYAFGVILYEVLTGSLPFSGDSYSALVLAIANGRVRPPRELRPELPAEFERVVLNAMEKDRELRVPSMDALITALKPFASASVASSSGSGDHASVEFQRAHAVGSGRNSQWIAAVALLAVVLAGLTLWALRPRAPVSIASEPSPSALEPVNAAPTEQAPSSETAPAAGAVQATAAPAAPERTGETNSTAGSIVPPRRAHQAARLPASARPEAATPAVTAPASARPRAGTISLDEL